MTSFLILLSVAFLFETGVSALTVSLRSDGPAVRGSNVTFTASVTNYNGESLRYVFRDDAQPHHSHTIESSSNEFNWTVEYPRNLYEAGDYTVTVLLQKYYIFNWFIISEAQTKFQLTDNLHGHLVLNQNSEDRPNNFVAVNKAVLHYVKLPDNELQFLKEHSFQIITYWFLDCTFVDKTTDFSFTYTYLDSMTDHTVGAVIVADNAPLQPITTTTTTIKTTTSLYKSCNYTYIIPTGNYLTVGQYQKKLSVKEPISNVNITGSDRLKYGDLLDLQVEYMGSPPFYYCIEYKLGDYNITSNETCIIKSTTTSNELILKHYFSDSDKHTVVVVIENDINKIVNKRLINIYKGELLK